MGWAACSSAGTFTGTNNDWVGYTAVTKINAAQLLNLGGTQMRITIRGGTAQGARIANCYVGMGTGTGGDVSFTATPTQILYSGASGVTAAAKIDVVSDTTTFTIAASGNLLIAFYFDSGANDDAGQPASPPTTGWTSFYSFGSTAADVSKTGWIDQGQNILVKLVEIFTSDTRGSRITTLGVR